MAVPIWKDYYSNLGAYASRYFRIRVNSTTIYQGKAVRPSSSGNLYVRINDICADYMAKKPGGSNLVFPVSFTVQQSSNGSSWTTVETVAFNDDWSYQDGFDPSNSGMSFPINGRVALTQPIYMTRYASGSVTATAYYGSTTKSVTMSLNTGTSNNDFLKSLVHAGAGYVVFDCGANQTYSGKTLTAVSFGGNTYKVSDRCPEYCLYYKNPFGGYDHLLLEGKCRKMHSDSRSTFVADYNNNYDQREEWTFQNEVTERWVLNTGFLSDDESSRMPYLLDSPDVYLLDLTVTRKMVPVTIATDSYEIRKYSSLDGMVSYQFEVVKSQKEYRQ